MTAELQIREIQDSWEIQAEGCNVIQCQVDYAFSLKMHYGRSQFVIRVENNFTLVTPDGTSNIQLDDKSSVCSALELLSKTLMLITAHKTGELTVTFDGGFEIHVPFGKQYEAWQVSFGNGQLIVSMPGGKLATWLD